MSYKSPKWNNGSAPPLSAENMQALTDAVQEHGEALETMCNPNLLDNWYFGNPVNQRGQMRYEGANTVYAVDRWRIFGTDAFLVVAPGSIKGIGYINQPVDNSNLFEGMQLTLSALLSDNTFGSKTFRMSKGMENPFAINSNGYIVYAEWSNANDFFTANWYTTSEAVGLVAIKLELGPQQTLAHQDANGNWVLNEIPEYGEQLRRCQRYYCEGDAIAVYSGADSDVWVVPLRIEMRTAPSVKYSNVQSYRIGTEMTVDSYFTSRSTLLPGFSAKKVDSADNCAILHYSASADL